jgi:hypothetical protein
MRKSAAFQRLEQRIDREQKHIDRQQKIQSTARYARRCARPLVSLKAMDERRPASQRRSAAPSISQSLPRRKTGS